MEIFLLINEVFWIELLLHDCPYFAFSHLVRQESEKYLDFEACASKLPASCLTPFKIKPESKVKHTKATKVNELITISFLNEQTRLVVSISNQITFIGLVSSENYYRRPRIITSIT